MISIVIPYYNQPHNIMNTLAALNRQTDYDFEVVLVNDGSKDIQSKISNMDFIFEMNYLYLTRNERSGRAYARNNGIDAAKGDYIVFLDCDQIIKNNFITMHKVFFRNAEDKGIDILQFGTRKELLRKISINELNKIEEIEFDTDTRHGVFQNFGYATNKITGLWSLVYSHNMSLSKKVLKKHGGFDEAFKGWGLEDSEIAYRMKKNNVHIIFNPFIETYSQFDEVERNEDVQHENWLYNYNVFVNKHRDHEVIFLEMFKNFFDSKLRHQLYIDGVRSIWVFYYMCYEDILKRYQLEVKNQCTSWNILEYQDMMDDFIKSQEEYLLKCFDM